MSTVTKLLIDNHWKLAKTVAVGGFIYGFLYTTATGRPAIDISAKATHTADNGDAADFQVNGMEIRLGQTATSAAHFPPRP